VPSARSKEGSSRVYENYSFDFSECELGARSDRKQQDETMAQHAEPLMRGLRGGHKEYFSLNVSPAPFPEGVAGMMEAAWKDDGLAAVNALKRWTYTFLFMIRKRVEEPVMRARLEAMGYQDPTEFDRYVEGIESHILYTMDVYDDPRRNRPATSRRTFNKPGFTRGFAVRPHTATKPSITPEGEDHEPYPLTDFNKDKPRPTAPIECVPSPQSAFGLEWDCNRAELEGRLRTLGMQLNFDKVDGWMNTEGISSQAGFVYQNQ
jgi:hypothetical protein